MGSAVKYETARRYLNGMFILVVCVCVCVREGRRGELCISGDDKRNNTIKHGSYKESLAC